MKEGDIMTDSQKLDRILSEMQGMKEELQGTKEEVQGLKEKVQGLDSSVQELSNKVTNIELTIENEIRDNIRCIAEGHLDLSRNLHEAMKPYEEIEVHSVKINMLETDVRELKARIS